MTAAGQRIVARLRSRLFAHLQGLEMSFFDQVRTGELVNRLSVDTDMIGKALAGNISNGLRAATQGVVGVSLMTYISPSLASVFLLVVPPIGLAAWVYGQTIKKLSRKTQTALAASTTKAEESFSNMLSVKAFVQEPVMAAAYDNLVDNAYRLSVRETLARAGFFGSAGLAGNLGLVAVLGYGGTLTATEAITVGDLSAFLLYTAYVGASIAGMASFHAELMKGVGASARIFDLLDRQTGMSGTNSIPGSEFRGQVTFQDVGFSYPSRPTTILDAFSLDIPAGSVQAIVGGSGSGKSTIFSLLLRLYVSFAPAVYLCGFAI